MSIYTKKFTYSQDPFICKLQHIYESIHTAKKSLIESWMQKSYIVIYYSL